MQLEEAIKDSTIDVSMGQRLRHSPRAEKRLNYALVSLAVAVALVFIALHTHAAILGFISGLAMFWKIGLVIALSYFGLMLALVVFLSVWALLSEININNGEARTEPPYKIRVSPRLNTEPFYQENSLRETTSHEGVHYYSLKGILDINYKESCYLARAMSRLISADWSRDYIIDDFIEELQGVYPHYDLEAIRVPLELSCSFREKEKRVCALCMDLYEEFARMDLYSDETPNLAIETEIFVNFMGLCWALLANETAQDFDRKYGDGGRLAGLLVLRNLSKGWPEEKSKISAIKEAKEVIANYEKCSKFLSPVLRGKVLVLIKQGYLSLGDELANSVELSLESLINKLQQMSPLPITRNIHEQLENEEREIIEIEKYFLEAMAEAKNSGDFTLLTKLTILLRKINFAKKLFVSLGWPCRHSHTNFDGDDGMLSVEELVDHAIEEGITVLYITGHNSLEGSLRAIEYVRSRNRIIEVLPGVEIESPFEDKRGIPYGYLHWRVIGPNDQTIIEKMRLLVREIDDRLESALDLMSKRVCSLGKDWDSFQELVNDEVLERWLNPPAGNVALQKNVKFIVASRRWKSKVEIRKGLFELFRELNLNYQQYKPIKFLNRLNIIGSWTRELWGENARVNRRCLRWLLEILFTDEEIEKQLRNEGKKLPMRAEEVVERFSDLGCYVIAAHPSKEIAERMVEMVDFIEKATEMSREGILHGLGTSGEDESCIASRVAEEVRKRSGKTRIAFRTDGSNIDFHGGKEKLRDPREASPDREGYFLDLEFLSWQNPRMVFPLYQGSFDFYDLVAKDFIRQAAIADKVAIPVAIFLGKPASGKGAIGNKLAESLGVKHISIGELLREEFGSNVGDGLKSKPGISFELLQKWFDKNNEDKRCGLIMDLQFESPVDLIRLEQFLAHNSCYIAAVFYSNISDLTSLRRLRRRTARAEEIAAIDLVGSRRIENFYREIWPFIEAARRNGLVKDIDSEGDETNRENVEAQVAKNALSAADYLKHKGMIRRIWILNSFYRVRDFAELMGIGESELFNVYLPLMFEIHEKVSKKDKITIALAGPTAVGKTNLARNLVRLINKLEENETYSEVLHVDGFYYTDEELAAINLSDKRSTSSAIKVEDVINEINHFIERGYFSQQEVSRDRGKPRVRLASQQKRSDKVLIVDGGFILNSDTEQYRKLYNMFDITIAMQSNIDNLKVAFVDRKKKRGSPDPEADWQRVKEYVNLERKIWLKADLVIIVGANHKLCRLTKNPAKIQNTEEVIGGMQSPNIELAFVVPTLKGGGVAEITKVLSRKLFAGYANVNGFCFGMVRDEFPVFSEISRRLYEVMIEGRGKLTQKEQHRYEEAMQLFLNDIDFANFTHVILQDPYTLGLIPLIRQRYPEIKIIWMLHGEFKSADASRSLANYLKEADAALFLLDKFIPKKLPVPAYAIANGIDFTDYKNQELSREFIEAVLRKFGVPLNRKIILHLGRFQWLKDPLASVQSFIDFMDRLPPSKRGKYHFVFIGSVITENDRKRKEILTHFIENNFSGYMKNMSIIGLEQDRVVFNEEEVETARSVGLVPDNLNVSDLNALEINAIQKASSLMLLPSCSEAFSLVVLEAMWKRKLIIATDVGGFGAQLGPLSDELLVGFREQDKDIARELYEKIYNFLKSYSRVNLSQVMDLLNQRKVPQLIAKKMHWLLEEMSETEQNLFADKLHRIVEERYSISTVAAKYKDFLERLSGGSDFIPNRKDGKNLSLWKDRLAHDSAIWDAFLDWLRKLLKKPLKYIRFLLDLLPPPFRKLSSTEVEPAPRQDVVVPERINEAPTEDSPLVAAAEKIIEPVITGVDISFSASSARAAAQAQMAQLNGGAQTHSLEHASIGSSI
ncbi:MAG: nucleoside monophosphate kinase [Candidatus Omnitrophica bacterium]|nr:nucleoside monophosphate kinase [Candidatus Omnitrophota bacterium]